MTGDSPNKHSLLRSCTTTGTNWGPGDIVGDRWWEDAEEMERIQRGGNEYLPLTPIANCIIFELIIHWVRMGVLGFDV